MKKIFIIILAVLFISCHKDKEIRYDNFSQTTLDYVYFKTGSLWVYKDSVSGYLDSIRVNSAILEKRHHGQITSMDESYDYDYLHIDYNNNFYKLLNESMSGQSFLSRIYNCDSINVNYILYQENSMVVGSVHNMGDRPQTRTIKAFYNQFQVQNHTFYNVYIIKIVDGETNRTIDYYLSRNMGIIKKIVYTIDSTKTWDLINWNVIQ